MLLKADARQIPLRDETVQCVVTSPPYWGLRAYGGEPEMIGLEPTFDEHLDRLIRVFREVRRVLRKDGCCFLNYGDAYAGSWGNYSPTGQGGQRPKQTERWERRGYADTTRKPPQATSSGLKPKDLMMMPARVAMALQADGWWLRSEIVWHKPNPMPESVRDQPTSAHEKIYLLTKSARYFYDAVAVRVPMKYSGDDRKGRALAEHKSMSRDAMSKEEQQAGGANLRNVWRIATRPFSGAHFATFPEKLVEPCILAGTSEKGCCAYCGAPWRRLVENDLTDVPTELAERRAPVRREEMAKYLKSSRHALGLSKKEVDEKLGTRTLYSWFEGRPVGIEVPTPDQWTKLKHILGLDNRFDAEIFGIVEVEVTARSTSRATGVRTYEKAWNANRVTQGWQPTCDHGSEPKPCIVLDPFCGSGTTVRVAEKFNRIGIGCDLAYQDIAVRRTSNLQKQLVEM